MVCQSLWVMTSAFLHLDWLIDHWPTIEWVSVECQPKYLLVGAWLVFMLICPLTLDSYSGSHYIYHMCFIFIQNLVSYERDEKTLNHCFDPVQMLSAYDFRVRVTLHWGHCEGKKRSQSTQLERTFYYSGNTYAFETRSNIQVQHYEKKSKSEVWLLSFTFSFRKESLINRWGPGNYLECIM